MRNCTAVDKITSLDWRGKGWSAKGPGLSSEASPVWRGIELKATITLFSDSLQRGFIAVLCE